MKTIKLIGHVLDYWVARCEGYTGTFANYDGLEYSTEWNCGGPIIERDQIFLDAPSSVHYNGGPNHGWRRYDHWRATVSARTRTWSTGPDDTANMVGGRVGCGAGETPLIAAMRAKVVSHYGDEVPDEVTR